MTDQIKSSSINANPKHYDIFLSHNSENKYWVRILAQNLKANNYKVFLDEWELKGGQKFVPKLFEAIKDSRMGIIVVSPRLITQCFEFLDAEGHFHHEKYIEAQQMKPFIWQLFTPFIRDPRNKDRLCELLKQDIVTHFTPYLYDPLIKSLYWKNLIIKDSSGKNLVWRCELLKSVGRNIMVR